MRRTLPVDHPIKNKKIKNDMGGFGADASGGGRHGMWGPGGVGGDVADLEGLGPRGVMSEAGQGRLHVAMAPGAHFSRRRHCSTMCTQLSGFGAREQR
jgi:hypothetical protein